MSLPPEIEKRNVQDMKEKVANKILSQEDFNYLNQILINIDKYINTIGNLEFEKSNLIKELEGVLETKQAFETQIYLKYDLPKEYKLKINPETREILPGERKNA